MKKSWFSKKNFDNFFYQFCRQSFLTMFFYKKIILKGHFEANAWGELIFFQKFWKKIIKGLKKHCSGCFLKQHGSFFTPENILLHRFHTQLHSPLCPFYLKKIYYEFYWQTFFTNFFDKKIILPGHVEGNACGEKIFFWKFQKNFEIGP